MPEFPRSVTLDVRRAALEVEAALRVAGVTAERLTEATIKAAYPRRRFVLGWRINASFPDEIERRIDLLVGPSFPSTYPRTALVDRPEHLTWPHLEQDGVMCLLPVMAEIDATDPASVALNLVGRSARLVVELLEGKIVDRDFREEFLTYWFYASDGDAPRVLSLLDPAPPSRIVRVWRDGKGLAVVGENDDQLERWLRKRFGSADSRKAYRIEAAAFLWLPEPPLPAEYPATGADLLTLAPGTGELGPLVDAAATLPEEMLVVMGAEGRGGAGLISVTTTSARYDRSRSGRVEKPLTKGFRDRTLPPDIAAERTYSLAPLLRSTVTRADAAWIHGRGKDPRTTELLGRTCTLIGCGSVGSSVAARLARSGVGKLRLVDHDSMEWSNVGRHELGAQSVGLNKAEELAKRLAADFPHLDIEGLATNAHGLIDMHAEFLDGSDLIIACTGSWQADGALNRWHVGAGRERPILYGWTESHACAGHAVTIAGRGGCLRCGVGATGTPVFSATAWPSGATLEEPACGNHFQPYGAIELGFVVDHIAEAALAALLAPPHHPRHALWLGPTERLVAAGGEWTPDGTALLQSRLEGACMAEREWPVATDCPACGETNSVSDAAASARENRAEAPSSDKPSSTDQRLSA